MTNLKQLDRLVLKIVRLKDVYSEYEVTSLTEQAVYLNGKKIEKGQAWGEEFGCGKFTFSYDPEKYVNPYLYVENGGVEHLLSAGGKPFGLSAERKRRDFSLPQICFVTRNKRACRDYGGFLRFSYVLRHDAI